VGDEIICPDCLTREELLALLLEDYEDGSLRRVIDEYDARP
jgi:hypothetical protein